MPRFQMKDEFFILKIMPYAKKSCFVKSCYYACLLLKINSCLGRCELTITPMIIICLHSTNNMLEVCSFYMQLQRQESSQSNYTTSRTNLFSQFHHSVCMCAYVCKQPFQCTETGQSQNSFIIGKRFTRIRAVVCSLYPKETPLCDPEQSFLWL